MLPGWANIVAPVPPPAGDTRPMHVEIIKRPATAADVSAAPRLSINIDAARYTRYYGRALPGFSARVSPAMFPEFDRRNRRSNTDRT